MTTRAADTAIRLSLDLPVPVEVAWSLITENAHIARWWGGYARLEPRQGGRFEETWVNGDREVITSGVVLAFEPPTCLQLSWADDGWPGATAVSFGISEAPGGVRLALVHDGWEVFALARRTELMANHATGWNGHLRSLAAYSAMLAIT